MTRKLSVGIALQSNNFGGPQKVSAIAALDLASRGHNVTIFIPVLPYFYYYMSLQKNLVNWIKAVRPYVGNWIRSREFVFHDLMDDSCTPGEITVKFVLRRATKTDLGDLDCLIMHSVDKVVEYSGLIPQERQIYFFWHPEERAHGHQDTFKNIRRSFKGCILTSSPFAARQIADHISNPPMVPAPISPLFWKQRDSFQPDDRSDILWFVKSDTFGIESIQLVKTLLEMRPATNVTAWVSSPRLAEMASNEFPKLNLVRNPSEIELCRLYLDHSMLLYPSVYEGFGMPPIEALACGCVPILYYDVGAAELYARDGENSVHLKGDPSHDAHRIANILDEPNLLKAMRIKSPGSLAEFDPGTYGLRLLEAAGVH